jgi:cytoskeletal protein CcmA (bactofilin family)
MTDYTKTTNFAAKDALSSGNANKIVKGTEINTEFDNIATAVTTKANIANPAFTGVVSFPDGSASNPSITNTGDTNAGLFFSAADTLAFSAGGTAQVTFADGVIAPVTDSDVDLGTNSLRFKDAYIDSVTVTGNAAVTGNIDVDGTIEFDSLSGTGSVAITDILDQDDMSGNSATALATQQSIKAYVDSQQDTVDTLGEVLALSNTTSGTDISVSTDDKVQFRDSAIYINSSADGQLDIVADTEIQIAATTIDINGAINASGEIIAASLDISGNIDVDGTTNLDVVDIDGAVDFASTTAHAGNATFADSAKAIFGAGSDLQIYHDGTDSFISDQGTGNLKLLANDFRLANAANNELIIAGNQSGAVTAYYAGAPKLATTNTGIDVTGTATMDGLTVDAVTSFINIKGANGDNSYSGINFKTSWGNTSTGKSANKLAFYASDGDVTGGEATFAEISTKIDSAWSSDSNINGSIYLRTSEANSIKDRLRVASNGDISFYEDTGSTAKFHWDSSAESLTVDTLTIAGNEIDVSSGDLTLDVAGDIILDAAGTQVILKKAGTQFGEFLTSSTPDNLYIKSSIQDKDIIFGGNDGGSAITALTLDMSAAGAATFNSTVTSTGLTVDGTASFDTNNAANPVVISRSGSTNESLSISAGDSVASFVSEQDEADRYGGFEFIGRHAGTNRTRLKIDHTTGDISFYEDTGSTAKLFWDSSAESLGIGTSSPDDDLHIANTAQSGATFRLENTNISTDTNTTFGTINFEGNDNSAGANGIRGSIVGKSLSTNGAMGLLFSTASAGGSNTERMVIDSSGNLLVGTTDVDLGYTDGDTGVVAMPTGLLQCARDSQFASLYLQKLNNYGDHIEFGKDGTTVGSIGIESGGFYIDGESAHSGLSFGGNSVIARDDGTRVDNTVDLGSAVHRFKDLYLSGKVVADGVTTSAYAWSSQSNSTSSSIHLYFRNPNGFVGNISTSGTATAYNTSSDYRLKENVVELTGATERLKQLNPSRFNFIADADTTVDGFLAHEVADVVPEAISGTKDAMINEEYEVTPAVLDQEGNVVTEAVMGTRAVPDYQGIDQSKLVPLLVAAIQELEARITQLENN